MIDFKKLNMKIFMKHHCESAKMDIETMAISCIGCQYKDGTPCTHPKHPTNLAARYAAEKAREIHIEAYDEAGNTYDKVVTFRDHPDRQDVILSFGWPCEYGVASLLKYSYPLKDDLCIDACGLNHKGHAVYVKKEDVNRFIKETVDNYWHH